LRILLIEDDKDRAAALLARAACHSGAHDAFLLDRKLPDGDGLTLIPHLRREQPGLPVIVLSDGVVRPSDRGAESRCR
jgi:DNA-binding response OmpR family regulator